MCLLITTAVLIVLLTLHKLKASQLKWKEATDFKYIYLLYESLLSS